MLTVGGTVLFLLVLGALVAGQVLPPAILFIYLAASAFSYLLYSADKTAARNEVHRIAEYKLHLLALLGGWPGAVIAQQVLRHKTAKKRFRSVFWMTVAVNCGFLAWLMTPYGADVLEWLTGQLG